jgi:NADPH-dependent curcumin reductase CurA
MMERRNHQIILERRPTGRLGEEHFRAVEGTIGEPGPGEVLTRTILLSVDPANRGWMQGRTYREQQGEGVVMSGFTLSEVIAERDTAIPIGTLVACDGGWQEYAVLPADSVRPIQKRGPLTHHLSVLGITGLTAYFGLLEIGRPVPGDTVLVSAAAGATGNVVGQLATLAGARAVGITGSDRKAKFLVEQLGFGAALNYRSASFIDDLRAGCPDGVDVYFDNVAGTILDAALKGMNIGGRVVCCGAVSTYDTAERSSGPRGVPGLLALKRLRMEGFIVLDYVDRFAEAEARLAEWVASGDLQVVEEVWEGLDAAPAALVGLLAGDNLGKRLVRVSGYNV